MERASDKEVVYYEDEVDIHLNPKIGEDWMARSQQKEVVTPGKNVKAVLGGRVEPQDWRVGLGGIRNEGHHALHHVAVETPSHASGKDDTPHP